MVFPTLFTITDVVLANHSGIMSIIENDLQIFAAKLKYLVSFAENKKRRNSLSICWKLRILVTFFVQCIEISSCPLRN